MAEPVPRGAFLTKCCLHHVQFSVPTACTLCRNDELRARVSALEEALRFYADPATYSEHHPDHPGKTFSRPIAFDVDEPGQRGALWAAGYRARKALGLLASDSPSNTPEDR